MKSEGTSFVHEPHITEESICRRHRQLLNWDTPGRRNHIHQINSWTLSAFQSESSYEKHEEKERWEGRGTWERARSITHWSETWSFFLSYDSEVVWAGGAPGLQLVMQWEPSSGTQGRINGWQRRHRGGALRHQPPSGGQGMSTNRENCKILTGCRLSLGPPWHWVTPKPPCPFSLCCLRCWEGGGWWCGTHHIQNHSGDLGASGSPQERWGCTDFHWGGKRLFLM